MKVTFLHLGTMHIFCKAIAETAQIPYIVPPETSRKTPVDPQGVACGAISANAIGILKVINCKLQIAD